MSLDAALNAARERNLDLVEVASNSEPPVCRLLDYDKFRYEQSKKEREMKKTQKSNVLSEVRLRPKISDHDVEFKTRKIREFLGDGEKVRVFVMFRGREITHPDRGAILLGKVAEQLQDTAIIDSPPRMEGRTMSMILAPAKVKAVKESRPKEREKVQQSDAEAKNA
jgi:translation initiation factor IF-3